MSVTLKEQIAKLCGSCKAGMSIKVLGKEKLIHPSGNSVSLGRCRAAVILIPHLIDTDEANNPIWDGQAMDALEQLAIASRGRWL